MKEPNRPEERRRSQKKNHAASIIKSEAGVDKSKGTQNRSKKQANDPVEDLTNLLSQRVVGQPNATRIIVPFIQMFQA